MTLDAKEIKCQLNFPVFLRSRYGVEFRNRQAPCLFADRHTHGDAHPSMRLSKDGCSVKCFAGDHLNGWADCFQVVQVKDHVDFTEAKRICADYAGLSDHRPSPRLRQILRRYQWFDAQGCAAWHLRWEPFGADVPKFTWAQDPDGKQPGRGACLPTLYALDAVRQASTVMLCEGEQDTDTVNSWLQELGRAPDTVATTTPNGAGDVKAEYLFPLDGKEEVVLTGDNDEAGHGYVMRCRDTLPATVRHVRRLMPPTGHKDWTDWNTAGMTAQDFAQLLDHAAPYSRGEAEQTVAPSGPWSQAQTAREFLSTTEHEVPMLYSCLLARGSITECFSPRGIGKTHAGHWLAVTLAKQEKRVLLLDRDNSRREIKRRLKAWGADGLLSLKVLTRDAVPPLTDAGQWRAFPFQDYDLVLIDSLESSTEGCGEQDSAKPSRALAPLLDIAHRENGPAILILGNTIKSGAHSRGSGVVEDRADVAFEVRDATDLTPSGTKDWWLELPAAGAEEWANRASRRTRRDTYRLAFIASKYRIGEEPDPFIWEITMPDTGDPWTLRDVTADVVKAGADAKQSAEIKRTATLTQAAQALIEQVRHRAEAGDPMLSESEAVPYLVGHHDLTRKEARQLLKDRDGTLWDRRPGQGKGHPQILVPIGDQTSTAAKMPSEESPLQTSHRKEPISAGRMDTGRRKSANTGAALNMGEPASLFSPPGSFIQDHEEAIDVD